MYPNFMLPATMNISTAASPALAGAEKEIQSHKLQSDASWYIFLVALLSILLLAQPDQRQSTGHKPTNLVTERVALRAR
jgi:hypothetical protein